MGRDSSKVLEEIFTLGLKLKMKEFSKPKVGRRAFQAKGTACTEAVRHGVFRKLLVV